MAHRYHTLLSRDLSHPVYNQWVPEFGAYDLADVEAERDDYRDRGFFKANELKIMTTTPGQKAINAGVAALNKTKEA